MRSASVKAGYDESAVASAMATYAGAVFHPVVCRGSATNLEDAVYFSEGLAITVITKYLLHRRIREDGFKVTLTGEGADELPGPAMLI
ncbi:MAG: asparagine synthase-related protein [Cyanobacteriota/Melainabacteria group bacterium]